MSDIARVIMESATIGADGSSSIEYGSDTAYDKLGQNLRENNYKDGDRGIVLFYTERPSDEENDKLHNAAGPAVVFANDAGEYDESNPELTFYFIHGKQVEGPSDPEYMNAGSSVAAKSSQDVQDVFGDEDSI